MFSNQRLHSIWATACSDFLTKHSQQNLLSLANSAVSILLMM